MTTKPSNKQPAAASAALPLFYKQPLPLVAERDADLTIGDITTLAFAAGTNSVPVVAAELPLACKFFPLLFATTGADPAMVALLGLRSGQNLFVDAAGQWAPGVYVPAYIRRYPFIFMENTERGELTLCLERDEPAVGQPGNKLFEAGEPSAFTKAALDFCREYQGHYKFTRDFIEAVRAADILIDNRADVTLQDGEKLSLGGFQIIDEARFNALPAETFMQWRERGWLHLVYCHLISISNWSVLIDRTAAVRTI